jgi:hypothetical protein
VLHRALAVHCTAWVTDDVACLKLDNDCPPVYGIGIKFGACFTSLLISPPIEAIGSTADLVISLEFKAAITATQSTAIARIIRINHQMLVFPNSLVPVATTSVPLESQVGKLEIVYFDQSHSTTKSPLPLDINLVALKLFRALFV